MANPLKPVVLTLFDGNKFPIVAKTVLSSHWLTWMDLNIRYSLNRWDQVVKRKRTKNLPIKNVRINKKLLLSYFSKTTYCLKCWQKGRYIWKKLEALLDSNSLKLFIYL